MDKAKSIMDQKGSGPCYSNGLQKSFRAQLANSGCNPYSPNGSCSTNGTDSFHHLHYDPETNGSPAKRCRLRRRVESVKKNRPRKLIILCTFRFQSDNEVGMLIFPAGWGYLRNAPVAHFIGYVIYDWWIGWQMSMSNFAILIRFGYDSVENGMAATCDSRTQRTVVSVVSCLFCRRHFTYQLLWHLH